MSCVPNAPEAAVKRNLAWFCASGVMVPADGSWGVAERIVLTDNNLALAEIFRNFPVWSEIPGGRVVEARRPDCNFQTALLYLLAGEFFDDPGYTAVAENILGYLYRKSGMIFPENGLWNWSNITKFPCRWFDDNGWCAAIALWIARRRGDLDRIYSMGDQARRAAVLLAGGVLRSLEALSEIRHGSWPDPEGFWLGEPRLPHWGAVALLAAAAVLRDRRDDFLAATIDNYYRRLESQIDQLIASELSYAVLGTAAAARVREGEFHRVLCERFARRLIAKMDPDTGNLPSEHCEAPSGTRLVDTIYTVNWALLGLQAAARLTASEEIVAAYKKLLNLVLEIQDHSGRPELDGCWRGMFDLTAGAWGGGNRYEGGADSIYTGWTNAPIAMALLLAACDSSLTEL